MPLSRVVEPEIQYATLEQQGECAQLGMWAFLINETLFFGALIFAYFIYRWTYPDAFEAAGKDAVLWCGTLNLALLLTSSLTIVLAVNAGAQNRRKEMTRLLAATAALGTAFLCVKGLEYYLDFNDHVVPIVDFQLKPGEPPQAELFWIFYWIATGLHAIHMSVGIGLVLYMLFWRVRRGEISSAYYAPLEVVGIYWSFVDTVWVFLYPCIYLMGRS